MPFLRATRDKRGYETTYVVHTYRSGETTGRTRVLYLFRTPPSINVGRRPLDDEARVALEHTHPDLSFDWRAIDHEMVTTRPQAQARPTREREGRSPSRSAPRPAPAAPPAAPVTDDHSPLARTLGAREAARLRGRYGDLLQRIGRRARGPEERDQLLERVQRLNPDDWGDEAAVRAGVSTVEAEWDAIVASLPSRRRGRRGGRRRDEGAPAPGAPVSGIIAEDGDVDEMDEDAQVAQSRLDTGDPGGDHRVGGPGPGNGFPGDD